jgi:UDP-GlcNAc:undecaprenyl-phosphate GlcNAc-1-phosphate transferase
MWLGALLAIVAACGATAAARMLARRFDVVANPNPIVPQHRAPVAYLGGLGLAAGLLLALLATGELPGAAICAGAGGMLVLGLLDDLRPLQPLHKLLAQGLIAAGAVALGLGTAITGHVVLDDAIVCVLVVAWVNAVNLTDVCDGLVAGLAAIALLGLFALTGAGDSLALLAAGACLGFLVFNKPAATIYLGDAGSHLLGFLLAAVSIGAIATGRSWQADLGALLCSGVFVFELLFLVWVRRARGLAWWRGSPDHFSLRLQSGPFSRWQTVLLAWLAGAALAGTAVLLPHVGTAAAGGLLAVVAAAVLWVTRALLRWPVGGPEGP